MNSSCFHKTSPINKAIKSIMPEINLSLRNLSKKQNQDLDKYYTNPKIAKYCYELMLD